MRAAGQHGVQGALSDGTPYFAPLGEVPYDHNEDRVQCHLCGGWYRFVGSTHLRVGHGWTLDAYREAFGLLKGEPTCAQGTSQRLRRHAHRQLRDGALQPGSGYAKKPGEAGRGVRRSQSLGVVRPDLVVELDTRQDGDVDPFTLGHKVGTKTVVAVLGLRTSVERGAS